MVKITGANAFRQRLLAMRDKHVQDEVGHALFAAGEMIQAEAQHLITEGSVSGRNHIPSLPGEPPANDTGVLKGNIEVAQLAPLRVEVSSNAPYSAALEFGTSKMVERPFMRPALQRKRKEAVELVSTAFKRALKKHR